MKLLCLIPAYNEKGNLSTLVKRLSAKLKKFGIKYTLLFIIQGTDGSLDLIKRLKKKYPEIDFLYFPEPLGIGAAYKTGFHHVNKTITHILTLDADLNHDPEALDDFFQTQKKENPDIVIGSRFMEGGRFQDKRVWKRIVSLAVNILTTKLLKFDVHDITSGYRLVKKNVIIKICKDLKETGYPSYMEFILLSKKYGFKMKEVPINYVPRKWGKSKMKKVQTSIDYLFFFTKLLLFSKNPD